MKEKRDKLIESLRLWLEKNDLTSETHFFTIEEWQEREEEYHTESEFVITTEGGLYYILNFGDEKQYLEFEDLVLSFGFFYELGNAWNIGFYYEENLENAPLEEPFKSYADKLRDRRWQNKRDLVKSRAGYRCQDCGSTKNLEVHHCYYQYGKEPWEYPLDTLRCLCRDCHEKRGRLETVLRAKFADLRFNELEVLKKLISYSILAYNRNAFFEFLNSLGNVNGDMDKKYDEMKTIKRFS